MDLQPVSLFWISLWSTLAQCPTGLLHYTQSHFSPQGPWMQLSPVAVPETPLHRFLSMPTWRQLQNLQSSASALCCQWADWHLPTGTEMTGHVKSGKDLLRASCSAPSELNSVGAVTAAGEAAPALLCSISAEDTLVLFRADWPKASRENAEGPQR